MFTKILAIAAGGAIGALLRFFMAEGTYALMGKGFPYGTLVVNVVGSFFMGIAFVVFVQRGEFPVEMRLFIMTGMLGALTTFSTFSLENLELLMVGRAVEAMINIVVSVITCVLVTWGGFVLAKQF